MRTLEFIAAKISVLGTDKVIYRAMEFFGIILVLIGVFNLAALVLALGCFSAMLLMGKPTKK